MIYKVGRCLLADRLREVGMSQQELADKLHMPRQQVSDYANSRKVMTVKNLKSVASILGCHMDDVYEWIPIKPSERSRKKQLE